MKNNLSLPLLFVTAAATILSACGNSGSGKLVASMEMDNILFEVESGGVGYNVENDAVDYSAGNSFLITLDVTNQSSEPATLDGSNFSLLDENNTEMKPSIPGVDIELTVANESISNSVQLEPGDTKKLILTYSIPGPGDYTLQIISPLSKRIGKVEF